MNLSLRLLPALILPLAAFAAADDAFEAPDSLLLKNGRTVHGLILKNTWNAVVLQEKQGETTYPKSDIVRIRDEANTSTMFTGLARRGDLPAWRVIANDLRTHDTIKSLVEIPATGVETGVFKNVPYLSFRANGNLEMNIYGDPENPAGFEIGIFGSRSGNAKLRADIRAFLAGFLATRAEIAALYAIPLTGGIQTAGNLTLEITPKTAPDAEGAWWISLYNPTSLAKVRLTDAQYARITRPTREVVDRHGNVIAKGWSDLQTGMTNTAQNVLRGFYRDKNGDFRVIKSDPAN